MDEEVIVAKRPWRGLRLVLLLLLGLLLVAIAVLWMMRFELATGYIDRELARRGVSARYEATRIGLGTQIFENLVIGDPARPDATAERVEVGLRIGLTAGASAPEALVQRVLARLHTLGVDGVTEMDGEPEAVEFQLPSELRVGEIVRARPGGGSAS